MRNKKTYFISDAHLGMPDHDQSMVREKKLVKWLDMVMEDAESIYFMGDLFEFWFEYKTVVQKGYIRLLGKLAELSDAGIPIYFFKGNHDVWAFNYLEKELGLIQIMDPLVKEIGGKTFFLAHGDGLGPGDQGYKFLKKVFRCRFNQWLFKWLHPDLGSLLGRFWSGQSRKGHERKNITKVNDEGIARLTSFCHQHLQKQPEIDYFIMGHVHKPMEVILNESSKYLSIGDWIHHFSYLEFDGNRIEIKYFK